MAVHFWLCFFYLDSLFDSHSVPVIPLCLLLLYTALSTVTQKTANHTAVIYEGLKNLQTFNKFHPSYATRSFFTSLNS